MPKIKSNDAQSAKSESVGEAVDKIERQRLKRKKSKTESCIRTDLIRLCPNEGKKADLAKLFDSYQAACVQMLPLAGNSTILQAAERVAKGILESHAGWLARDVSELVGAWRKRNLAKLDAGSNVSPSSQDAIQKICREL